MPDELTRAAAIELIRAHDRGDKSARDALCERFAITEAALVDPAVLARSVQAALQDPDFDPERLRDLADELAGATLAQASDANRELDAALREVEATPDGQEISGDTLLRILKAMRRALREGVLTASLRERLKNEGIPTGEQEG